MDALKNALDKVEVVIYKTLVWVILIPKTLLWIVLRPGEAPDYIHKESNPEKDNEKSFDEYLSPIMLLLIVALVPFVAWRYIPPTGVVVTANTPVAGVAGNGTSASQADTKSDDERSLDFIADVRFISTVTEPTPQTGHIITYWHVEKEDVIGSMYTYLLQGKLFKHTNNFSEKSVLGLADDTVVSKYVDYIQIDNHTIQDTFSPSFTPGTYRVIFVASKFKDNKQIEVFENQVIVHVPKNKDDEIIVDLDAESRPDSTDFSFKEIATQLESETTVFLALGLLILPLLFAMVIQLIEKDSPGRTIFRNPLDKDVISENGLKETFYIQCYYFSPIAFMFWATRYVGRILTPDVFFYSDTKANLITWLPIFLLLFWFISVQTRLIREERGVSTWRALSIMLVCITVLVVVVYLDLYFSQPAFQDAIRKTTIWLYPLLAIGLLVGYYKLVPFLRGLIKSIKDRSVVVLSAAKKQPVEKGEQSAQESPVTDELKNIDQFFAGLSFLIIVIAIGMVFKYRQSSYLSREDFDVDQKNLPNSLATTRAIAITNATATAEIQQTATIEAQLVVSNQTATAVANLSKDTQTAIASAQPTATPTTPPTATPIPPTMTPPPTTTFTPLPDPRIYKDEFIGNFINAEQWTSFVTSGDESAVNLTFLDGKLSVDLDTRDGDIYFYLVNNQFSYADVQVETESNNIGNTPNTVSLICRANDAGWYEFEIENSGYARIYAYDGSYFKLSSNPSVETNPDSEFNKYKAVCKGSNLELYVNDMNTPVLTAVDERFKEGYIGLVASSRGKPVNVDFDYIDVGEPKD